MALLTISVRIAYLPNRTTLPNDASARDGWMSWTAAARSPSGCTRPPATTTPPGERPQVPARVTSRTSATCLAGRGGPSPARRATTTCLDLTEHPMPRSAAVRMLRGGLIGTWQDHVVGVFGELRGAHFSGP